MSVTMTVKKLEFAPDYLVSENGMIFHDKNGTASIIQLDLSNGYPRVRIKGKRYNVSKLVAEAFVPRIYPACTYVKHKNGDVTDNRKENLEWTTMSDLVKE